MNLTKQQTNFVDANQKILEEIFTGRIEEVKEVICDIETSDEDRKVFIKFLEEYKTWLNLIGILKNKDKEDKGRLTNRIYK